MLRRTFALLVGALALSGCAGNMGPIAAGGPGAPTGLAPGAPGSVSTPTARVAILLPLSGPRGEIGQAMLRAAQVALDQPGAPTLDVRDTAGAPQDAARVAQEAIGGGAQMILGPLTSAETASVAPVARAAGIPVLAFTNDSAQGQPGVWPLGITPRQQVFRLVAAAQARGNSQFAGLLPDNEFGRSMAIALQSAAISAGLPPPRIQQYGRGMAALMAAMADLSQYEARGGVLDPRLARAQKSGDVAGKKDTPAMAPAAANPDPAAPPDAAAASASGGTTPPLAARPAVSPPPFDTLLLADTGEPLAEIAALLPYYEIPTSTVRILGPALWATPSSGASHVAGGWFAAPDRAARTQFATIYAGRYGGPPPAIADLAFDAASIARVLAHGATIATGSLTQPAGFAGSDGLLALQPDGMVRRGLAVFEVQRSGPPTMVEPPPPSLLSPGT